MKNKGNAQHIKIKSHIKAGTPSVPLPPPR